MDTKPQCPEFRERERHGLWLVCTSPLTSESERVAQAMATKCQCSDFRERGAQVKAINCQSAEFKAHAKNGSDRAVLPVVSSKFLMHSSWLRRATLMHLPLLQSTDI